MRKINALDASLLCIIVAALSGFALARAGYAGVDQIIEGVQPVALDIYLIGVKTLDTDIFKPEETTAVTIRNRPVQPPLKIKAVKHWQHTASYLAADGKSAIALADPATPVAHDYIVTLQDNEADRTKDGFVIRGNKVKIGNIIELEGFKYRVQGVVVDITPVSAWKPPVLNDGGASDK